jgi:hypothetical protein
MIRKVHVFQCGSADLYGVTQVQTGANLPVDECKEGWRFLKTVEMDEGLPPRGMAIAWQVASLNPSSLPQAVFERGHAALLCSRRERTGDRAAEERDELPPPHTRSFRRVGSMSGLFERWGNRPAACG